MLSWKIKSILFKYLETIRGILAFGWLYYSQDSRFGSLLGHRGSDGLQNYKYFIIFFQWIPDIPGL